MIKILVVDDHPVFRHGLSSILNKTPEFQVIGDACNGTESLAKVAELKPDVVVMDIFMRGGDGIETTTQLRQSNPNIGVLILSMSDSEDDLFRAIKAGAKGYLLKNVGLNEIIDSIKQVARGDAVLSPAMAVKLMQEFRETNRENARKDFFNLSPRECEILQLAAQGASNKEIADKCFISETTVKAHFRNILEKLHVRNRAGAVALAASRGLLKVTYPADSNV